MKKVQEPVNLKEMSSDDIARQVKRLCDEQERRQVIRQTTERQKRIEDMLALEKSGALNILAPKHTPGRYGRNCSDDNLTGGMTKIEPKDWHCLRCLVLDIFDLAKLDDIGPEITLSVTGFQHR